MGSVAISFDSGGPAVVHGGLEESVKPSDHGATIEIELRRAVVKVRLDEVCLSRLNGRKAMRNVSESAT